LKRPTTAPARALASWACALGAWLCIAAIHAFGSTWRDRMISLGVALALTAGIALLVARAFRRSVTRPLPSRGLSGRLARQPPMRAVLVMAGIYLAAGASATLYSVAGLRGDVVPSGFDLAMSLIIWTVAAAGAGTFWTLAWQRQREREC
jgi:hypothetical protein